MSALLELKQLKVAYGGIEAVKGIDLSVQTGEMVALIGANGAGKTTTLKAIAGLLAGAAGVSGGQTGAGAPGTAAASSPARNTRNAITYNGQPIGAAPAHQLARAGLVLVPEGRGIFPKLTVNENLTMGAYLHNDTKVEQDRARVFGLFPRLKERAGQTGGTLSGGEQQMLAIGRALMTRPRLLLLDEPGMGLAPLIVQRIFDTIKAIAAEGVTIFLVEQNARLALEITQRAYVMESGLITLSGDSKALLKDEKVRMAYLGE